MLSTSAATKLQNTWETACAWELGQMWTSRVTQDVGILTFLHYSYVVHLVISVMSVDVLKVCSLLPKLYHHVTSRVLQFVRTAMLQGQIECEVDWNDYLWPCGKNSWGTLPNTYYATGYNLSKRKFTTAAVHIAVVWIKTQRAHITIWELPSSHKET
jgi:hypothetical protein